MKREEYSFLLLFLTNRGAFHLVCHRKQTRKRLAWAPTERKKGAVCDCSRQALRDTQIMFVSSNLISPLLGELEGVFV